MLQSPRIEACELEKRHSVDFKSRAETGFSGIVADTACYFKNRDFKWQPSQPMQDIIWSDLKVNVELRTAKRIIGSLTRG